MHFKMNVIVAGLTLICAKSAMAAEPIRVGVDAPLSSPFAPMRDGLKLALAEENFAVLGGPGNDDQLRRDDLEKMPDKKGIKAGALERSPPPGLYRVDDIASSFISGGGAVPSTKVDIHTDGTTGNTQWRGASTGGVPATRQITGQGPVTFCMPKKNDMNKMPFMRDDLCVLDKGMTSAQGISTYIGHCSFADITLTVRQVDNQTWEYASNTTLKGSPGTANSGAVQMMENMAKNGASAEDREAAAQGLVEMRAQASVPPPPLVVETMEAMKSTPAGEIRSVHRITRIAESCAAAKPH